MVAVVRLLPVLFVAAAMALVSCKGDGPAPNELAAHTAKEYYDHLLAGRYDEYLAGVSGTDSIPASYREQLLVNARQFMAQQQKEHGGISEVRVVRAVADSLGRHADVYLMLCFGDSAKEEVVVPMVSDGNRWMMR